MTNRVKGVLYPLLASAIWGFAFVAQVVGAEHLGTFSYTAIRFAIGMLALLPAVRVFEHGRMQKKMWRPLLCSAALTGTVLFVAVTLQQWGIELTQSAGKAGFLTGLYIVLVPLTGVLLGKRVGWNVWGAVVLGVCGALLLCVTERMTVGVGDLALLACAGAFTAHILLVDKFVKDLPPLHFSIFQFATMAILSAICIPFTETVTLFAIKNAALSLLYGGLLSVGVAYTLQMLSQQYADPAKASLLFACESVFSAIGGALILGERMTWQGYLGCALIFAGILLSQVSGKEDR